jgi:hypothetical protein
MREPEMVGLKAGCYVSRRSRCRRPISDGANRGRLCADCGHSLKVNRMVKPTRSGLSFVFLSK